MKALVAGVIAIAALTACTAGDGGAAGVRVSAEAAPSVTASAGDVDDGLTPYRIAAQLQPCPESDPDIVPLEPVGALGGGLPALTLECLDDGPAVTLSGLRGTPMIVNVWASWCPPCIAEMPVLQQAATELGGEVLVLGIDLTDRAGAALDLLTTLGVTFPSVVDEPGAVRAPLLIPGPPVTFFVDADGRIAGRHDGAITDGPALARLLESSLGITADLA